MPFTNRKSFSITLFWMMVRVTVIELHTTQGCHPTRGKSKMKGIPTAAMILFVELIKLLGNTSLYSHYFGDVKREISLISKEKKPEAPHTPGPQRTRADNYNVTSCHPVCRSQYIGWRVTCQKLKQKKSGTRAQCVATIISHAYAGPKRTESGPVNSQAASH